MKTQNSASTRSFTTKRHTLRAAAFALVTSVGASTALMSPLPAQAQYGNPIGVVINGTPINVGSVAPIREGGRVLVPLRGVLEALGATVGFNNANSTVSAQRGSTNIRLQLGSRQAYVNEQLRTLDVPARTIDGRTVVPLRFMSEALGAQVQWNPARNAVYITASGVTTPIVTPPINDYVTVNGTVTANLAGARRFQVRTDSGVVIIVRTMTGEPANLSVGDRVRLVGNYNGNFFDAQTSAIVNNAGSTTLTGTVLSVLNNRRFSMRANGRVYTVNVRNGIGANITEGATVRVTGNLNGNILQRATVTYIDDSSEDGQRVNWNATVISRNITGNSIRIRAANGREYVVNYGRPEDFAGGDRVNVRGTLTNGQIDDAIIVNR